MSGQSGMGSKCTSSAATATKEDLQPPWHPRTVWLATTVAATTASLVPGAPPPSMIPHALGARIGYGPLRLLIGAPLFLYSLCISARAKKEALRPRGYDGADTAARHDAVASHTLPMPLAAQPSAAASSFTTPTSTAPQQPAPTRLVTSGIYAKTRNPQYLAALLLTLGAGFLANSAAFVLLGAVPFWVYCHTVVTPYEVSAAVQFIPYPHRHHHHMGLLVYGLLVYLGQCYV